MPSSKPVVSQSVPNNTTYTVLLIGVTAVSVSAILIRLADTDPLAIATYRMCVATLVIILGTSLAKQKPFWTFLRPHQIPYLLASGILLAIHFTAFNYSLYLTSVANSVFLVTTAPIFVALGSYWLLKERISSLIIVSLILSVAGGLILSSGVGGEKSHLGGDALAVLAAATAAGYMLIGRKLRPQLPLLPYITVVYAVASCCLLIATFPTQTELVGLPTQSYLYMISIGIICQVIGHSALNWSLAYISATVVSISIRIEPIVATLLAIPILDESPSWILIPGGALLTFAVYLAIRSEQTTNS